MIEVAVALVGAVAIVAVAWIGKVSSKLGTPNGQGNVVEMLQQLLVGQTGQDTRLADLETGQHVHAIRLDGIDATQRTTTRRLAQIEAHVCPTGDCFDIHDD